MKAYELLSDPLRWLNDGYCRKIDGRPSLPNWPDAFAFCALAAIRHCYGDDAKRVALPLRERVRYIGDWNDSSDHATVVATLRELDI